MELNDALTQISEIRQHMARAEMFRGYRAATTAFTGAVALSACFLQAVWPADQLLRYLLLWLAAAVVSLAAVAWEMISRCRRSGSALQRDIALQAAEQFIPCLVAGGLLAFVLARFAPELCWMLPGLWAMLFALGIFASRRMLPRGARVVGGYYLITGLICLASSASSRSLAAWQMAVTFGAGQLLAAAVLYWNLERQHG